MVNVMIADIARGKMQPSRQIIERTALHGCFLISPVVLMDPIGIIELVLDVKQPDRAE